MLSLQSDPRQYHQQQAQQQQQQQHNQHQQLLQQVAGIVPYNNGFADQRSDLTFALHNDSGASASSSTIKQELLSREGFLKFL